MDLPLVSVIIPCFNAALFVEETLECVNSINYSNWECVKVDDGSTDNSVEIIENYCKLHSNFKFIIQKNAGPAAARNNAIKNTSGKYILPLDADDKISKDYIGLAVKVLEASPNVKLVYCEAELFFKAKGIWRLKDFSLKEMLYENKIFCSALYRRSDYNSTSGYDERFRKGREDWDFWLRLLKSGGEVVKLPDVHFYYRKHKKARTKSANKNIEGIRKLIYENHKELYNDFFDNPINIYHQHAFYKTKYNILRKLTFRKPIE